MATRLVHVVHIFINWHCIVLTNVDIVNVISASSYRVLRRKLSSWSTGSSTQLLETCFLIMFVHAKILLDMYIDESNLFRHDVYL